VASDPYRAPESGPDVPVRDITKTEPQPDPAHEQPTGTMAALWVPIAIAVAFAAGPTITQPRPRTFTRVPPR
jgi:hypothetical protein